MLCRVTSESVDEIRLKCDNSNHIKETEQYFAVVLFNMLYKAVLTFESFNEILIWQAIPRYTKQGKSEEQLVNLHQLLADCRLTDDQQFTDRSLAGYRQSTVYRQVTDRLPTVGRHVTDSQPSVSCQIAKTMGKTVGQLSANCRPTVGRLSPNCRPTVGRLSANCRPTVGRLSPNCRPTAGPQSANSWATVGRQSMEVSCSSLLP